MGAAAHTRQLAESKAAHGLRRCAGPALNGDSSRVDVAETVVVRNADQWQALWARRAGLMVPTPPAPPHDFDGRQTVGVFLGARPNGCFGVEVTAVVRDARALVVRYREERPADGQYCTAEVTQPHALVWVLASSLPVRFKRQ